MFELLSSKEPINLPNFFIGPRSGTISPWSSKTSEIITNVYAISIGIPKSLMGCSSLLSSIAVASRGVFIVPGEIALTLNI